MEAKQAKLSEVEKRAADAKNAQIEVLGKTGREMKEAAQSGTSPEKSQKEETKKQEEEQKQRYVPVDVFL